MEVWINGNMQSHESFTKCACQTEHAVIELKISSGTRRVALVAVLSSDRDHHVVDRVVDGTILKPGSDAHHAPQAGYHGMVLPGQPLVSAWAEADCKACTADSLASVHDAPCAPFGARILMKALPLLRHACSIAGKGQSFATRLLTSGFGKPLLQVFGSAGRVRRSMFHSDHTQSRRAKGRALT